MEGESHMEWRNIYRGLMMGASDVIPGVSGATIAVILGIYDRLIAAVNGLASKQWRKMLGFLVPLGIGITAAILLLSRVMEWLFMNYHVPTNFFFLGLILGVLPYLSETADFKKFKGGHFLLAIIGVLIVGSLGFLQTNDSNTFMQIGAATYVLLFIAGFIASSAMILPGISGSFMLLIMGVYPTVIMAVSNFRADILLAVGAGVIIGILVMSKVINYFLKVHYSATFALIIGMVIGSIVVIFPGWPEGSELVTISVAAFAAGLSSAYLLGKVEHHS